MQTRFKPVTTDAQAHPAVVEWLVSRRRGQIPPTLPHSWSSLTQGGTASAARKESDDEHERVGGKQHARRVQSVGVAQGATFSIIMALSFSHFLNDMMQSLVPALYPMLKGSYGLSFAQIGLITLTMQLTSSLLQPAVGLFPIVGRSPTRWRSAWV